MVEIELSPLSDPDNRLRDILRLPDIIDIRFGRIGLCFYFYPVESWSWRFYVEKINVSYNNLLPYQCKHVFELTMPTMAVEFTIS